MSYEVKHVKEINYCGMSEEERKEIWRLDDLRFQQMTTSFYDDGEYFALYEDVDNPADKTANDSTYAVYMGKSGELLCLLADSGVALTCCDDSEYGEKRAELYKQIALAAGWPEKLPTKKPYTVTLKRTINMKVYAADECEAEAIGDALAAGANELACMVVNEAMCKGDDELVCTDDFDAGYFYHATLDVNECEDILRED